MAATGILKHVRHYASAGVLTAFAGVVSFPVLTRTLTIEDYGALGLITASLTLIVAIGKLGLQNSIVRFYSQVRQDSIAHSSTELDTTITILFVVLAVVTTALWLAGGFIVVPKYFNNSHLTQLFLVASGTVFMRLLSSALLNTMQAARHSADVAKVQILVRYVALALMFWLLWHNLLNPYNYLICLVAAEFLGFVFAAWRYWPNYQFDQSGLSAPLARALLSFGIPLMVFEALVLVMRLSDRYIIEALLGGDSLGMYSASYNLVAYLDSILLAAIVQSVRPTYLHLWETETPARTEEFLRRGFAVYLLFGIPFCAWFSLVSPHVLTVLASPKYAPGTVIIPYVTVSFIIEGMVFFLGAGLYISKGTRALVVWAAIAASSNVALNVLIVPHWGISGAAAMTIVAYTIFAVGLTIQSFRILPFSIDVKQAALISVASVSVYWLIHPINWTSDIHTGLVKGILSFTLLCPIIITLDKPLRLKLLTLLQR